MNRFTFENLCALLADRNIAFETLSHNPVFTMEDVARELEIPCRAMAKTLLVVIDDKGLYRVVVPGMSRLSMRQLALALGVNRKSIHFADKETVEKAGFTVGAIPPFGGEIPTLVDSALLVESVVYCGAGDNDKTFSLSPKDIVSLTSAIVTSVIATP